MMALVRSFLTNMAGYQPIHLNKLELIKLGTSLIYPNLDVVIIPSLFLLLFIYCCCICVGVGEENANRSIAASNKSLCSFL